MSKTTKRMISSAKKIIDDNKNANLFLDIMKNLKHKDEEVQLACLDSVSKVINHWINSTQFIETDTATDNKDLTKDEQFHRWIGDQFKTTLECLLEFLDSDSSSLIQTSSFEAIVTILSGLGGQTKSDKCTAQSIELAEKLMSVLVGKESDSNKLIGLLPALLAQCENTQADIVRTVLTSVEKRIKHSDKTKNMESCWFIIMAVANSGTLEGKEKQRLNKMVLLFLRQELPVKMYREILTGIDKVMEAMTTPLLLADFLSSSFDVGGAISLMSLNGLFSLMHKYNLNYPDFYEKLYSMFQPQIFGAKYRSRFFHLADLFLSSTHLPAYLIAAFTKRLARLCLHAPASGIKIAVPFIFNLIHRHPACDALLHKNKDNIEYESDPFLDNESPINSKALESSLWELKTLEWHFDPSISSKAKKRTVREEDISTYLDQTVTEIMEFEVKKRRKEIPLAFEKQTDFNIGIFTL